MGLSQAPTRPATKKARKPAPQLVYQTFCYERGRKAWGSYTRTAQAHGLSDDTVKRIVDRFEQPEETPPEVQYQPAPGQVEYEVKREQQAREMAKNTAEPIASVNLSSADVSQPTEDHERECIMSNSTDSERETRKFDPLIGDSAPERPQPDSLAFRIGELEAVPQIAPKLPQPAISLTADYVSRREQPRSGLDLAQLVDLAMLMVGPVPLGAWLVFGLVVLLLVARG